MAFCYLYKNHNIFKCYYTNDTITIVSSCFAKDYHYAYTFMPLNDAIKTKQINNTTIIYPHKYDYDTQDITTNNERYISRTRHQKYDINLNSIYTKTNVYNIKNSILTCVHMTTNNRGYIVIFKHRPCSHEFIDITIIDKGHLYIISHCETCTVVTNYIDLINLHYTNSTVYGHMFLKPNHYFYRHNDVIFSYKANNNTIELLQKWNCNNFKSVDLISPEKILLVDETIINELYVIFNKNLQKEATELFNAPISNYQCCHADTEDYVDLFRIVTNSGSINIFGITYNYVQVAGQNNLYFTVTKNNHYQHKSDMIEYCVIVNQVLQFIYVCKNCCGDCNHNLIEEIINIFFKCPPVDTVKNIVIIL